MIEKISAVYWRHTAGVDDLAHQESELVAWIAENRVNDRVEWYRETPDGRCIDCSQWRTIESEVDTGKLKEIVIWRMNHLPKSASQLTRLFSRLINADVNLLSLHEGLDLFSPDGRLAAQMVSNLARYESEAHGEKVREGQSRSRAAGRTWGGRTPGLPYKMTSEKVKEIRVLLGQENSVTKIAQAVGLSRESIYQAIVRYGLPYTYLRPRGRRAGRLVQGSRRK